MIDREKLNDQDLDGVSGGFRGTGALLRTVNRLGSTVVANPIGKIGAGSGMVGNAAVKTVQQTVPIQCICGNHFTQTWYTDGTVDPEICPQCGASVANG